MTLRLHAEVCTADTDYGTVLLDQRTGAFWQLNPTAALAVRRLLDGDTPERAAAAMASAFDVGPDDALTDVLELVDQLRAAGLVSP
ncbi:lasso peptide biosynthesis PqqD family chaperone [[Actinomadura] parvosata]|uniref:lasso peptide biosynthesis PqqD family chaperone n=1 Tax=[Actinomadura] parvosata TaxID=1955412 RepID=UPI00406C5849